MDYDLHSRILVSLAEVLADSRTKTTIDEVEKLVSKCPDVPILPLEDLNIVIPNESFVGRMVGYTTKKRYAFVTQTDESTYYRPLEITRL